MFYKMNVLVLTVMTMLLSKSYEVELDPLSDEFIDSINNEQSLWKAGRNFPRTTPMSYIRSLMGLLPMQGESKVLPKICPNLEGLKIPDSFDWREHFPNCSSLRQIRDQGACGSCWAFGTVEVIADRICIHSNGKTNVQISANNLVACGKNCLFGCGGGLHSAAFEYWRDAGIVTGGEYNSSEGCQPYEIPPCNHTVERRLPSCDVPADTPKCRDTCETGYPKSYQQDLYFGKSVYSLCLYVKKIQAEIMENGPVAAGMYVYEDFNHYKSGVYKHTKGNHSGGHVVKILGWGVEEDTPYWLVANSWNADWGDKGYFKILRGTNHCGIEEQIVAGIPA